MKILKLGDIKKEPVSHNPKILKRVFIKKGQIPGLTQFAQSVIKPGQISSEHVHQDMYESFLVEGGAGIVKIDGKVIQIQAGYQILIEPGEAHEFLNTGGEDMVLTYFSIEQKKS